MENINIYEAYRTAKANADKWKKEADDLGKILKAKMKDTPKVINEGYAFERKVSVRSKLNEDNLLEWLKENGFNNAITTKEVINEDVVSMMLEEGELSTDIIDKFTTKSEVVALYCKKSKGE